MKSARIKKNNKEKINEKVEESYSIKNMILITIILFAIFGIFYFLTTIFANSKNLDYENNSHAQIDLTTITLNHLLDRKEKEYYVIATKNSLYEKNVSMSINYLNLYNNYINDYMTDENALKFYFVDLDDALNKNYISSKQNITDDLNELKLTGEVLFKIKEGKIEKFFVGSEEILEELSKLKEK